MQAAHRVIANTGILYVRMMITVFMSLYSTRLILSALGVEDFGLFNLVGGIIAMLNFLNGSMASATQRFISHAQGSDDINKVTRIFNMSVILHLCTAIFVFMMLEIVGYFLFNGFLNIAENRENIANILYQFMVASTLFTVIAVPYEAVITSHENMIFYAGLGILEAVLKLAIALYISYGTFDFLVGIQVSVDCININHNNSLDFLSTSLEQSIQCVHFNYQTFDNLMVYGLLTALLSVLMLIVRAIYCHRKYPECAINFNRNYDNTLLKQMTGFGGWSFLGTTSTMIANYGQSVVINIFFGTTVNAAQGIASQISGQLGVLSNTLMKALNPMITKNEGAGNRKLMMTATMMGCKVSFFLMMALHIPFLIETPFILKLWLNNVPDFAVIFCRLLLIRNLIEQLHLPLMSAIFAEGKIKGYQIVVSILALFPLPISYFLFKNGYPADTLYVIFIFYSILFSCDLLYYAKKNCQMILTHFFKNIFLRCTISFMIVFLFSLTPIYFINEHGLIRLTAVIAASTISYMIVVFFIGLSKDERIHIKKMTNLVIKKVFHETH